MTVSSQDKIRQRAFEIWEAEGHPQGRDLDHWLRAESELGAKVAEAAKRGNGASAKKTIARKPASKTAAPVQVAQAVGKRAPRAAKAVAKA